MSKLGKLKYQRLYLVYVKTMFIFNAIELTALSLLTYVSSVDIFFWHQISFVIFLASSFIYMTMSTLEHSWPQQLTSWPPESEIRSKKCKSRIYAFYILSIVLSLCFYVRHNNLCEPYVYSMFSLCEYCTVLSNIAFHMTIILDMNLYEASYKIVLTELKSN